jgi:putative FmdB family regulatory protein
MAIYDYRCARDGAFEATWPLGTAPNAVTCSICGGEAKRVFSSPMLSFSSPERHARRAAIERAEKSRTEPEVVTCLPPRRRSPATAALTPALRRLPRP